MNKDTFIQKYELTLEKFSPETSKEFVSLCKEIESHTENYLVDWALSDFYLHFAMRLKDLEYFDEAESKALKALSIHLQIYNDNAPYPRFILSEIYFSQQRYDQALDIINEVLNKSLDKLLLIQKARIFNKQKNIKNMIETCEQILPLSNQSTIDEIIAIVENFKVV